MKWWRARHTRWAGLLGAVLLATLFATLLGACTGGGAAVASPSLAATATAPTATTPNGLDTDSGLQTVARADLPPEAGTTIALIASGGPFPYAQDGSTFQNRERILPARPKGYYREYTVPTPASSDRGARRLVTGQKGEMYYTDDHYSSFRRVIP
jgi:ribonuclease T1